MGELSIFNLQNFVETNKCKIYVETGTGIGVCLNHMLNYDFDHFYSIDLDGDLIESARKKFNNNNITFIHNYSTTGLEELMLKLDANIPILFFLDAHFPGADFGKMTYEQSIRKFKEVAFPLLTEIQTIKKYRDISMDSFIIDDWKLYDNSQTYEMPGWEYDILQDELGITTSADLILSEFLETHDCEVKLRHQGFLFVTPKF